MGLRDSLTNRHWLIMLAGTAGTSFLLDYAYHGNIISTSQTLSLISSTAATMTKIALQLAILVVAAVPGYCLPVLLRPLASETEELITEELIDGGRSPLEAPRGTCSDRSGRRSGSHR